MKLLATITTALVALAAASCSAPTSQATRDAAAWLEPLYGTRTAATLTEQGSGAVTVSIEAAPIAGAFYRLHLPDGLSAVSQEWESDGNMVYLGVPIDGALDLGVAPAQGSPSAATAVTLLLGTSREVSRPPTGAGNVVDDLSVTDAGGGMVSLDWTEVNRGDFDFNSEVNISDLAPLAARLGNTYSTTDPNKKTLTDYWVDGDGNGEINISDLTTIAASFQASVHGYNIKKNGVLITTAPRSGATLRAGLPPTYNLNLAGAMGDAWVVAGVDAQGNEGAGSDGSLGPVDFFADLNITGADLFNLIGSGSGQFGPGKFSSRVIYPIDIVDRASLGSTSLTGTQVQSRNLPRGRNLMLDILYAPTINLVTGAPKTPARIPASVLARSASDIPDAEKTITSIPFPLPVQGQVDGAVHIDLLPNLGPEGGYFVDVTADLTIPGDDPSTPLTVEPQYSIKYHDRLAYATGRIQRDTDDDGDFDDEAEYSDDDKDNLGNPDLYLYEVEDDHPDYDEDELEVEGLLELFDPASGLITLNVTDSTPPGLLGSQQVRLTLDTDYVVRHRTPANEEGVPYEDLLNFGLLTSGAKIEIHLAEIFESVGGPLVGYWATEVRLEIDDR